MNEENKNPFSGKSDKIETNEENTLKNENSRRDIKTRFYAEVILSKPFKILLLCLLCGMSLFLALMLAQIVFFHYTRDLVAVSACSDTLYKLGAPFVGFFIYLLSFGKKNH